MIKSEKQKRKRKELKGPGGSFRPRGRGSRGPSSLFSQIGTFSAHSLADGWVPPARPHHRLPPLSEIPAGDCPKTAVTPSSISIKCLPVSSLRHAYKNPSLPSPFPSSDLDSERPRAARIPRRSPLPPLLETTYSDEVTQPRPLPLASSPSFSSSASRDTIRWF
jgi:hypothetical protein